MYSSAVSLTGCRSSHGASQPKMNAKVKLAILIVCSTCFVTIWRLSSCLIFKAIKGTSKKVEKIKYCSCSSCLSAQDLWFIQQFDKSVNPFLTSGGNMTEEDYNWWKVNQPPIAKADCIVHLMLMTIGLTPLLCVC